MIKTASVDLSYMRTITQLFLAAAAFLALAAHAHAKSPDFDGDGVSDLTIVRIGSSGNLDWGTTVSGSSVDMALGTFGRNGDHLILSDWEAAGVSRIGVVSIDGGAITWKIVSGDGSVKSVKLGKRGDTVISGANLGGSAVTDGVVVGVQGKRLRWTVRTDLFTTPGQNVEFLFGNKADKPFFAPRAKGAGDVAAIYVKGKKGATVQTRALNGSKKGILFRVPTAAKAATSAPLPLRGKKGAIIYAFVISRGANVRVVFVNAKGKLLRRVTMPVGDIVVGSFDDRPGEDVASNVNGRLIIVDATSGKVSERSVQPGIAVDEININTLGESSGGGNSPRPVPVPPGGGGNGGGNTPPPPPSGQPPASGSLRELCATVSSIVAGQMLIKSEISNHITNPGDPRMTGYTMVCASQCTANLHRSDFFYENGEYAGSVGYYGRFSGNGQPRLYGGAGGAPQHFVSQIAAKARGIGSGRLYMQVSKATKGANTHCKVFNPTGRNGGV